MTVTDMLLVTARAQIGVKESPANSNNVKYNTWYYNRKVSGKDYSWCMVFVQWCFDQIGMRLPYKTASCSGLLNWYKSNKPECIVSDPLPGDIIIYNFGHTGLVESVATSTITAIEGNTSSCEYGSQSNGGGVFRRTRSKTLVIAYIRPYLETDKTKEDNSMDINMMLEQITDEQAYSLLEKAQRHAAKLPEPKWSRSEGHWQRAIDTGLINGGAPEGAIKRDEFVAVMGRRGLL